MGRTSKNLLDKEQSPYLQQHAQNPVHWVPWDKKHLLRAEKEQKLVIISVGYAACHWCHVMEKESFEDPEVAEWMNEHFVCIKVDREERPDIDHVYMQALQILTGQGGWPMNMVSLADGRPVWGGTYFKKKDWLAALKQLVKLHRSHSEKLLEYANQIAQGMYDVGQSILSSSQQSPLDIAKAIEKVSAVLDNEHGGSQGAPKFMMPSLLELYLTSPALNTHGHFTLRKIALGGVFDLLGGGFSRYAVDERWHIPHFEKMAYDNGQLLRIYAMGYLQTQNPLYLETIKKTIAFLSNELEAPEGGYFAALDADSPNAQGIEEEGAYYSWKEQELIALGIFENEPLCTYFGLDKSGHWEDNKYVLFRQYSLKEFQHIHGLGKEFVAQVNQWEKRLLQTRNKRRQPQIDRKILCGWNAMIGRGLLKVAQATNHLETRKKAKQIVDFMAHFHRKDGGLYRWRKNKQTSIDGFLEDYAHCIALYFDAYETFFEPHYLHQAQALLNYCLTHFMEGDSPLFQFSEQPELLIPIHEVNDNVIPSSNAVMAENLLRGNSHLLQSKWHEKAIRMCNHVQDEIDRHPRAYSTWLRLALRESKPQIEIAILGENAFYWAQMLQQLPLFGVHWAASDKDANLPLLAQRFRAGKTLIYVCENNQCHRPIDSLEKARVFLEKKFLAH